jgi:hypothetical protein
MFVSRHQHTGQSHNLRITKLILRKCGIKFIFVGATVTNQSCFHEKNKEQIKLKPCLLPFCSRVFLVPIVLYWRGTCSFTQTEGV